MKVISTDLSSELLLADSSRAHLERATHCAKESGRDRAMIAGRYGSTASPARRAVEHPAAPDLSLIASAE
jgi:hypothetical protein